MTEFTLNLTTFYVYENFDANSPNSSEPYFPPIVIILILMQSIILAIIDFKITGQDQMG